MFKAPTVQAKLALTLRVALLCMVLGYVSVPVHVYANGAKRIKKAGYKVNDGASNSVRGNANRIGEVTNAVKDATNEQTDIKNQLTDAMNAAYGSGDSVTVEEMMNLVEVATTDEIIAITGFRTEEGKAWARAELEKPGGNLYAAIMNLSAEEYFNFLGDPMAMRHMREMDFLQVKHRVTSAEALALRYAGGQEASSASGSADTPASASVASSVNGEASATQGLNGAAIYSNKNEIMHAMRTAYVSGTYLKQHQTDTADRVLPMELVAKLLQNIRDGGTTNAERTELHAVDMHRNANIAQIFNETNRLRNQATIQLLSMALRMTQAEERLMRMRIEGRLAR